MAIYLDFFGLQRDPFGVTPDPEFLYQTSGHREALAQLMYGIQERKGFILLTAEVGTGKTTLLHAFRAQLDSNTAVAYVANSMLPFNGILEYMLEEFEINKPAETHAQRLVTLQNFLVERHRAGQSTVLILDEAQNLYPQTLEQIRLLSNFETTKEKILQIVLVGQPELRVNLERPELRQLNQRIGLRCSLPALTANGTRNYIRMRLQTAGATDPQIFTDRAIVRITEHARGIPRIINTLCDHWLVIGYADQTRRIDAEIVDEAIAYFQAGRKPQDRRGFRTLRSRGAVQRARRPPRLTRLQWSLFGAGAGIAAGIVAVVALHPDILVQAYESSTSSLAYLTRSARELMRP
jgi:general secretion pathway protein A